MTTRFVSRPSSGPRSSARGSALVEVAVALPVLVLLVVGAVDFGRVFYTTMLVTNAARVGAQYGAQNLITSGDTSGMQSAGLAVLTGKVPGSPTVIGSRLCQCATDAGVFSNTSPVNSCSATCAGGHLVVSVNVTASAAFSTLTPLPGVPGSLTITRTATARAQ